MTRITLDLDPSVVELLLERARRDGKSIGRVASDLLARALADGAAVPEEPARVSPNTRPLGAACVDLDDRDAVWSALDEPGT